MQPRLRRPCQPQRCQTTLPPGRAHTQRKRERVEGRSHRRGGPCGAGREGRAGSGRPARLPGRPPVGALRVSSRFRLAAPLTRVCSSGGAQPRAMPLLPASRRHMPRAGAARLRPAQGQPGLRRSALRSGLSRLRPRGACAGALWLYLAARCPHGLPSLARHTARPCDAPRCGARACVACAHRRRQRPWAAIRRQWSARCPGMAKGGLAAAPAVTLVL